MTAVKSITSQNKAIDVENQTAYDLIARDLSKAQEQLEKNLIDAKDVSYEFGYAKAMQHIAWLRINFFDLPGALEAINESQDIFSDLGEPKEVGICWNYQAWIYYYLDDHENRLICNLNYLSSIDPKLEPELHNTALSNLGDNYVKLGQLDKALETFKTCLDSENQDKVDLGPLYNNLGEAYLAKGDYKVAEEWFLKAIEYLTERDNSRFLSYSRVYLADLYLKSGQNKRVLALLKQAQQTSELHSQKRLLALIHKQYAMYYESVDKHKEALSHYKMYMSYTEDYKSEAHSARLKSVIFNRQLLFVKKENELEHQKNEDLQKAYEIISEQSEELLKANGQLKNFAYNASHDLKEPLRTMSTFSKLLKSRASDKLTDDEKEYLDFISGSAKRMDRMVNDLLSYATISKEVRTNEAIDLNELIGSIESDFNLLLKDVEGKLEYERLPSILSNYTLVKQLFQNLIANAIKFRKEEVSPLVKLSVKESEFDYIFEVKDNGIGIKKEDQDKIFDIFTRLNNATEYPGSGIGLATCKKIAEQLNGKIIVDSIFGSGTTFTINLPK